VSTSHTELARSPDWTKGACTSTFSTPDTQLITRMTLKYSSARIHARRGLYTLSACLLRSARNNCASTEAASSTPSTR
jgi:hypothetical protein